MSEPLDKEAFFRVSSNCDAWLRLAGVMTADELGRAVRGALNVLIVLEHEYRRRFPTEYAIFEQEIEGPR